MNPTERHYAACAAGIAEIELVAALDLPTLAWHITMATHERGLGIGAAAAFLALAATARAPEGSQRDLESSAAEVADLAAQAMDTCCLAGFDGIDNSTAADMLAAQMHAATIEAALHAAAGAEGMLEECARCAEIAAAAIVVSKTITSSAANPRKLYGP